MTRYYDFNHRGAICAFDQECEKEVLTREELVISRTLKDLNARYFVVMKRIDDDHMLVAPVFTKQPRKDGKRIQINGKRFWVNFMTFYVVPYKIMMATPGKYMDYSYKSICGIYHSHNSVLKEKWRRQDEAKMVEDELRRMARKRKYNQRRYDMSSYYPIPKYVRDGARHAYSGGLMH